MHSAPSNAALSVRGNTAEKVGFHAIQSEVFSILKSVRQLRDLGIRPTSSFTSYDEGRWGFDRMDEASDDR
jgi:hypothetical protein